MTDETVNPDAAAPTEEPPPADSAPQPAPEPVPAPELAPADSAPQPAPEPVPAPELAPAPESTSPQLIGVPTPPPEPEAVEGGQTEATHAIAPGSAGPPVQALAQLVEQAGETTYLSDGSQNPGHVFTDDLMAAIRRVLHAHPSIAGVTDEAERQRLNRWISGLEVVTAEVHKLIAEAGTTSTAATPA